ncbi:hypothetical protein GGX14DRAFT_483765, partial [Mycena pura]
MHLRHTLAATALVSASVYAAPLFGHPEHSARRSDMQAARRHDLAERLTALSSAHAQRRTAPSARIQQFERADGSNACIDGALDWLVTQLADADSGASASNTSSADTLSPRASADGDMSFVDACIQDVVDWAVTRLAAQLVRNGGSTPPGGGDNEPPSSMPSAPAPSDSASDEGSLGPAPTATDSGIDPGPSDGADPSASASASSDAPVPTDSGSDSDAPAPTDSASAPAPSDDGSGDGPSSRRRRAVGARRRLDRMLGAILARSRN